MAGQGFASMSRKRLVETSARGGKNANKSGKKHQWSKEKAKAAGAKGTAARLKRMGEESRVRLINFGFNAADLAALNLSTAELIFYGGKRSTPEGRNALEQRINAYKEHAETQHE